MSLKIIIFLGSCREDRFGNRVGNFIKTQLEIKNHEVTVLDPLELECPVLKKALSFYGHDEPKPEWLVRSNALIEAADGFVVVSSEYNRCIPPALTNMMDHFPRQTYRFKPCSIVTYSMGPAGGHCAGMQLRCFLGELGMVSPGYMVIIGLVHTAFEEDGTPTPTNTTALPKVQRLVSELEWYASALKIHTEKSGRPFETRVSCRCKECMVVFLNNLTKANAK